MKKLIVVILFLMIIGPVRSQKLAGLDRSSLDIAYLPHNFAHDRKAGDEAIVKVIYSRPQKKDRKVFGGLVKYGDVWRTGANEATEIRFYKNVKLAGKDVMAGTYSLFTIPGESNWTIILNSDLDYWGHYSYKETSDVLRVDVPSKQSGNIVEAFTIQFTRKGVTPAMMTLAWDTTLVEVPIEY